MRTIKNLVGSVLIALAVFLFWVLILPDYNERSSLVTTIQTKTADLEARTNLINKTLDLDKEYQSRYAELKRLSLVAPAQKHVEEMITILQQVFSATGVPLIDMALSSSPGQAGSDYNLVSMEFVFNTKYDSVINFLLAIEKSLRLIDTTSLTISINQQQSVKNEPPVLSVIFKANAYYLKDFEAELKAKKTETKPLNTQE